MNPTVNQLAKTVSPTEFRWITLVIAVELALVGGYFSLTSAEPTNVRYALYPFVWINVGLWAVVRASSPSAERRYRVLGVLVAGGYFLVLATVSGSIAVPVDQSHNLFTEFGLHIAMGAPGWGPAVAYITPGFQLMFVPYLVIGYLSLAYLVYLTVLEATSAAVSGVLGLVSCVGCTFPVAASLIAGFAGGSSALTTAIYSFSIDISTTVFVLAVALLYWRPGVVSYSRE
jgi:hypothetical protein